MPSEFDKADFRVLVIGCGSIGLRHIKNLLAIGVCDIIAFDAMESARQSAGNETGIKVVDDLQSAWKMNPRVAFITASTAAHIPLSIRAAQHDCHLFIEKPLSHSLAGLDELMAETDRRRLVSMVACNMRFHPGPAAVKQLIEKSAVGEPIAARIYTGSYLPRWRPRQDYRKSYSASPESGGVLLDCIHEIDLALWYLGSARLIAAAHVPARSIGLDTDGLAEILLQHHSGCLTSVHLNFIQRDYRRGCRIICSNGTISWDFNDKHVCVFDGEGKLSQTYAEPERWELNQVYLDEIRHFFSAICGNSKTMNSIADAILPLQIALSAREGGNLSS
jgi:predicted dehydrogenase